MTNRSNNDGLLRHLCFRTPIPQRTWLIPWAIGLRNLSLAHWLGSCDVRLLVPSPVAHILSQLILDPSAGVLVYLDATGNQSNPDWLSLATSSARAPHCLLTLAFILVSIV